MAAPNEFLKAFLNLDEIKDYVALFFEILPSPSEKTMDIVQNGHNTNPFRFMAFAYGVLALTNISEPLFGGDFSFADEIAKTLLMMVSFLVFAAVQYKILKDVSHTTKTFDDYLVFSAIIGGMTWILLGSAQLVILFSEVIGGLLALGTMIYIIPYGIRANKQFWEMSYGKIFLYSFLSSIAATIAFILIAVLLGAVFGLTIGVINESPTTDTDYTDIFPIEEPVDTEPKSSNAVVHGNIEFGVYLNCIVWNSNQFPITVSQVAYQVNYANGTSQTLTYPCTSSCTVLPYNSIKLGGPPNSSIYVSGSCSAIVY